MEELTPDLDRERQGLLAEVYDVFRDVNREGGISWSEAVVLDDRGSPKQQAEARKRDKDTRWQDLVDDPRWRDSVGVGGFSFLDAIGFRYYLAASMARTLSGRETDHLSFHLQLNDGYLRDWKLS